MCCKLLKELLLFIAFCTKQMISTDYVIEKEVSYSCRIGAKEMLAFVNVYSVMPLLIVFVYLQLRESFKHV